ncbi:DUF397 domain-containing protein [Streptomyces filipinensis]|uniref:DUF397 domain-containing protein n=1 Tax=Streptomyces filipinensis TaxID=66887 RepID=UPI0036F069BB
MLVWRKSSASGPAGDNCVEVSLGSRVVVRDSKVKGGPCFAVSSLAWSSFLVSVRRISGASRGRSQGEIWTLT